MFVRIRFFAFAYLLLFIALIANIHPATIQAAPRIQPDAPPSPWTRTNPGGGGWFATIGAGPDGLILAASDLSGFYRSADRGQRWDVIGQAQGLTTTHASAIGFHPSNPDILFLGTEEGLFRSGDGGDSVHQVLDNGYITDIEISASDPQIGYAAYHSEWNVSDGSVYKSKDNGQNWTKASVDLPDGLRILKLALDPADADTLYLLSGEGRFAAGPAVTYRSVDGGLHWSQIGDGFGDVMDLAVAPSDSTILYLAAFGENEDSPGRLYRSDDRGGHWSQIAQRAGRIWLDPNQPQIIRLIEPFHQYSWDDRNGVWESMDGGARWTQVSRMTDWDAGWTEAYWAYTSDIRAVGDDLSAPDALLWANSQFAFITEDGGRSFRDIFTDEVSPGRWQSRGLDNVVMFDLAISEADPDDIYLGYFDIGCWHSPDWGLSWEDCNDVPSSGAWDGSGGNTTSLVTDPELAGVVWAAQAPEWDEPGHLLWSGDSGATWETGVGLPQAPLMGLALDHTSPAHKRTLFVAAEGDVYRSEDDGEHWAKVFDCDACRFTAVDRFDGDLVYAGGEGGLWRSTEGGASGSWTAVGLPEMAGTVSGGIWEWGWEGVFAITPDPHARGTVYVAAYGEGKGLYRSTDSGVHWQKLWNDDFLRDVAVSPQDPAVLIATSSSAFDAGGYDPGSNGVLRSTDGGQSWRRENEGMAWPFADPVAFDPANASHVWVGSPGTGFQQRVFNDSAAVSIYLPVVSASPE